MNEHGRVPIKLYLWALKFEFQVIFTRNEILLLLLFYCLPTVENQNTILSSLTTKTGNRLDSAHGLT